MQKAQNGRRTHEGPRPSNCPGRTENMQPGQRSGTGDPYEEALAQTANLAALIWAAQEADSAAMRESFVDLMNMPLQALLEALEQLEEELQK